MQPTALPSRWQQKLASRITHPSGQLGASDFPTGVIVRIDFEDGSHAEFRHAFVMEAPEISEIAVFTEHCGYYVFQQSAVEISVWHLKQQPND